MSDEVDQVTVGDTRVTIYYDQDSGNPFEEWDNLGTFLSWDNRGGTFDSPDEDFTVIGYGIVLPIFQFTHGGQVGIEYRDNLDDANAVIFVSWDKLKSEGITDKDQAIATLKSEVETYQQWYNGDVYGYTVETGHECGECGHMNFKEVDACWGFYGGVPVSEILYGLDTLPPELKMAVENMSGVNRD
jgi:hypothetical protein